MMQKVTQIRNHDFDGSFKSLNGEIPIDGQLSDEILIDGNQRG